MRVAGCGANDFQFDAHKPGDLRNLPDDVADAEGAVVRWSLTTEGVDKVRGFQRKSQPAVGVADFEPFPGQDSPSAVRSFSRPSCVWVRPRMVMGPLRTRLPR